MQIVYLSNRPKQFQATLQHVALFMPFIDQALVLVPDDLLAEFNSGFDRDCSKTRLRVTAIAESEVLTSSELISLKSLDHQRRNYLLRSKLVADKRVNDQFIMSDDDFRPLKAVAQSRFIENEKYTGYYCYDMAKWPSSQTAFDAGQHSTFALLQYFNLPHLSYASHMPQIIDKALFLASADFFAKFSQNHAICEWSSYFNYALFKHPQRFNSPQAYVTLCWPENPLAWRRYLNPSEYVFENYTRETYQNGSVFSGLGFDKVDEDSAPMISIEKIARWQQHHILSAHPEQSVGLAKYLKLRTWINKLASPYN